MLLLWILADDRRNKHAHTPQHPQKNNTHTGSHTLGQMGDDKGGKKSDSAFANASFT